MMGVCIEITGGCVTIVGGCVSTGGTTYAQAKLCAAPFTLLDFWMTTTDAASFPGVFTTPKYAACLEFGPTSDTPGSLYTPDDATASESDCVTCNSGNCISGTSCTASAMDYSILVPAGFVPNSTASQFLCADVDCTPYPKIDLEDTPVAMSNISTCDWRGSQQGVSQCVCYFGFFINSIFIRITPILDDDGCAAWFMEIEINFYVDNGVGGITSVRLNAHYIKYRRSLAETLAGTYYLLDADSGGTPAAAPLTIEVSP